MAPVDVETFFECEINRRFARRELSFKKIAFHGSVVKELLTHTMFLFCFIPGANRLKI